VVFVFIYLRRRRRSKVKEWERVVFVVVGEG